MRQPSDDRALYYREIRHALRTIVAPAVDDAQAIDTLALIDRILVEFIVEEEDGPALSAAFGARFRAALAIDGTNTVEPDTFHGLRAAASEAARTSPLDAPGLAAIEHDFLEHQESRRLAVGADLSPEADAVDASACSVTVEQLTEYLRSRLAEPYVEVADLTVVPGGRSKETILVSLTGSDALPSRVIVRKDRPVGMLPTVAADEFEIIKAVHEYGGVPCPQPFLVERDPDVLGGTFLVMECVPGVKAGEYFPDLAAPIDHCRELGLQLARGLARLHSLPLERLTSTSLDLSPAAPERAALIASVEQFGGRAASTPGLPNVNVAVACRWLVDHVDDVVDAGPPCLTQGDFGLHNMLIDGDRVTALVDWEAASIAPPVREIAAAWNAVHALCTWEEFVSEYVASDGDKDACDPTRVLFYRMLAALGGFLSSRYGGHLFRTGAKRDILTAHSGLDSQFRSARNLARVVADTTGAFSR